jgi:hypothetical protein
MVSVLLFRVTSLAVILIEATCRLGDWSPLSFQMVLESCVLDYCNAAGCSRAVYDESFRVYETETPCGT